MVNSGPFHDTDRDRNIKGSFRQENSVLHDNHSADTCITTILPCLCNGDLNSTADKSARLGPLLPVCATRTIEPISTISQCDFSIPENLSSKEDSLQNKKKHSGICSDTFTDEKMRFDYCNVGTEKVDCTSKKACSFICSLPLEKVKNVLISYNNGNITFLKDSNGNNNQNKNIIVPRKLLCLYCERSFVTSNLRQKHVERCHSIKQIRRVSSRRLQNPQQFINTNCMYCDKLNDSDHTLENLFKHLLSEHSDKYFACVLCEDRFCNSTALHNHNINIHGFVENFKQERVSYSPLSNKTEMEKNDNVLPKVEEEDAKIKNSKTKLKLKQNNGFLRENLSKSARLSSRITNERTKPEFLKIKTAKSNVAKIQNVSSKKLRCGKKITVKSTKIGIKRSSRIQNKIVEDKHTKKRVKSVKIEVANDAKEAEKINESVNPYPEFDSFFRVKKITDHSIDNLRISTLTFDDVFDKAFFNRIKCNIQENLTNHIDGKLFKNEESESRISNFEKITNIHQQDFQSPSSSENYGCEVSLNAATPVVSLLSSQFGEDLESQIEYGSKASKRKTKKDEVHYKYFTRRKYQASILEHKENRDLSKLDMWTQLVVKERQQKIINDKKSAKELLDYAKCQEYQIKLQNDELNRILDKRGPFEDLIQEASKKAALDKLNSKNGSFITQESFSEISDILNEILEKVVNYVVLDDDEQVAATASDTLPIYEVNEEIPSYLNLRKTSLLPSEEEIDKSDKITLICSSQETENFEAPNVIMRNKNELVELTGEWARTRIYICAACGTKVSNMKQLIEHKSLYHQNVWCQHFEFVGNQSELYRHLSIPSLGKVGRIGDNIHSSTLWKKSDARLCSKCGKQYNTLGDLHRHVLECGGDWSWMLARKKCKYRPFGSKSRRKRRGLIKRNFNPEHKLREKRKYQKRFVGPRSKPSDAESIQRMLANLPAKRATRKIISLKDGFQRPRKTQPKNVVYSKTKKLDRDTSVQQKTLTGIDKSTVGKTRSQNNLPKRKSLRNINKVLTSRILDTTTKFKVKRKLKHSVNNVCCSERDNLKQNNSEGKEISASKKNKITSNQNRNKLKIKMTANENKTKKSFAENAVKQSTSSVINIKSFFPVRKTRSAHNILKLSEIEDDSVCKQSAEDATEELKLKNKRKLKCIEKDKETATISSGTPDTVINITSLKNKKVKVVKQKENSSLDCVDNIKNRKMPSTCHLSRKKVIKNKSDKIKSTRIKSKIQTDVNNFIQVDGSSQENNFLEETTLNSNRIIEQNTDDLDKMPQLEKIVLIAPEKKDDINEIPILSPVNINCKHDFVDCTEIEKVVTSSNDSCQLAVDEPCKLQIRTDENVLDTSLPKINFELNGFVKRQKLKKPIRGLNDCIAMLTNKLQQKVENLQQSMNCSDDFGSSGQPVEVNLNNSSQIKIDIETETLNDKKINVNESTDNALTEQLNCCNDEEIGLKEFEKADTTNSNPEIFNKSMNKNEDNVEKNKSDCMDVEETATNALIVENKMLDPPFYDKECHLNNSEGISSVSPNIDYEINCIVNDTIYQSLDEEKQNDDSRQCKKNKRKTKNNEEKKELMSNVENSVLLEENEINNKLFSFQQENVEKTELQNEKDSEIKKNDGFYSNPIVDDNISNFESDDDIPLAFFTKQINSASIENFECQKDEVSKDFSFVQKDSVLKTQLHPNDKLVMPNPKDTDVNFINGEYEIQNYVENSENLLNNEEYGNIESDICNQNVLNINKKTSEICFLDAENNLELEKSVINPCKEKSLEDLTNIEHVSGDLYNKKNEKCIQLENEELTEVAENISSNIYLYSKETKESVVINKNKFCNKKRKTKKKRIGRGIKVSISNKNRIVEDLFCDICNKLFKRAENLIKHKRTLTHIAKLSEIEAQEAAAKQYINNQESDEKINFHADEFHISTNDIKITDILQDTNSLPTVTLGFSNINTNSDTLKLADIINDVLNKPVSQNSPESSTFSSIILDSPVNIKTNRCKSLGERKSFEIDHLRRNVDNSMKTNFFTSKLSSNADSILEKQISLLENIIENRSTVNYNVDEISVSSNQSTVENTISKDFELDECKKHEGTNQVVFAYNNSSVIPYDLLKSDCRKEHFIKPVQYEEISNDNNFDEQKSRKTLNRDEELFLECCSLLKSGSEVSNYSNKKSLNELNSIDFKSVDEPEWLEKKTLSNHEISNDFLSDTSTVRTPLGGLVDDMSNSNTISSSWQTNNMLDIKNENEEVLKSSFIFDETLEDVKNETDRNFSRETLEKDKNEAKIKFSDGNYFTKEVLSGFGCLMGKVMTTTNFDTIIETAEDRCEHEATATVENNTEEGNVLDTNTDNKKMLTKGAMKIFEGLKVSIPTEELDMAEVLNCSPTSKRLEIEAEKDLKTDKHSVSTKINQSVIRNTVNKTKLLKTKFKKKLTKRKDTKRAEIVTKPLDTNNTIKTFDVYDFEETQDNLDGSLTLFRSFRNFTGPDELNNQKNRKNNCKNQLVNSERHSLSSSSSNSSESSKKSDKSITKKKCMIMGRIFKNAIKSKIDEDIRDIPVMDNSKLVESYVLNCTISQTGINKNKHKMSVQEMDQLFDKLLNDHSDVSKMVSNGSTTQTVKNLNGRRKYLKSLKCKKRHRFHSHSTDDEFNVAKVPRKRISRKKIKDHDDGINLEQELKECIGVASRKSQRKCTSGKQNVLVEFWSSDESITETFLKDDDYKTNLENYPKIIKEDKEVIQSEMQSVSNNTNIADYENFTNLRLSEDTSDHIIRSELTEEENSVLHKKSPRTKSPKYKTNTKTSKKNNTSYKTTQTIEITDTLAANRRKRPAVDTLYYWSSSSEDEFQDMIEIKPIRDEIEDADRPVQHGWIVGDSPKKLVTMLAQAKGKKIDSDTVKEQGKKRTASMGS